MNEQNIEQNIEVNKLDVGKLLTEGWRIYKENYRLLVGISFLGFLISLTSMLITYFKTYVSGKTAVLVLSVSEKVWILPTIFVGSMLCICTFLCIQEFYCGRETAFRQMYKNSYEIFWRYFGTTIAYSLLWIPTVILIAIVAFAVKTKLLMWPLLILAAIPGAYLGTIYMFAIYATVFESRNTSYFKFSKWLVKGNFWRIVLLTAIVSGPSMVVATFRIVSPWYKTLNSFGVLFFGVVESFISLFYTPLVSSIMVIMYFTLREKYLEGSRTIPRSTDLMD